MSAAVTDFVEAMASLRMDGCFNPYSDRYPPFDVENAPAIRRDNLTHVLQAAAETGVADLWIGLELGHNGGRRTGLAMTDDARLSAHGARFGVADRLQCATRAGPTKEMTAAIVWEALAKIERPVFLWNIVPVHPHRPAEPLSNRRHTGKEREICLPYLTTLIGLLRPQRLVGVGNDACAALKRLRYSYSGVRHPAFGGRRKFLEQVACLPEA
ncbi:MAG TPA: uracil-DNA glycosylase [Allosphingosinicella sp.]